MKKALCRLAAVLILTAAIVSMFAACGKPSDEGGGNGTFTPPVEEDPYVTELSVVTPPLKTEYKVGQTFDPAGMKLLAKWSHGEEEDIFPSECKQSPDGPLQAGTTEITFTYEGVSCTQAVTIVDLAVKDVIFDVSALDNTVQLLGVLDLTDVTVTTIYEDDSEYVCPADELGFYENDEKIVNPAAYNVLGGAHTITVRYGEYSESFTFTALGGYEVPVTIRTSEDVGGLVENKESFLVKPEGSYNYSTKTEFGITYLANVHQGSILRYYIYSDAEMDAELVIDVASTLLCKGNWGNPLGVGEVQFNKVFDVSRISVDQDTAEFVEEDGVPVRQTIAMDDNIILPRYESDTDGNMIFQQYREISLGEITLDKGYNVFELSVKDCDDYKIKDNPEYGLGGDDKVRAGNIRGFRVLALNSDEHEHVLVKTDAVDPTCSSYGGEAFYRCTICARTFSDAAGENRIFNAPVLIPYDPDAHNWDREHADCTYDQVCLDCGAIGETKIPHDFGGQDLCTSDAPLTCTICGKEFKNGHLTEWQDGVLRCLQCGDTLAYKVQAEDLDSVTYKEVGGKTYTPKTENTTEVFDDAGAKQKVSKNAEGSVASSFDNKSYAGRTIEIKVNVDEAGTYLFRVRSQSNSQAGGLYEQDFSAIWSYCANPDGTEGEYVAAGGKSVQARPEDAVESDWKYMYRYGVSQIGEVELGAGENTVVIKFSDDFERGPNLDWFTFEKKDAIAVTEAEILTSADGADEFALGSDPISYDTLLENVYMRIAVPESEQAEVGAVYLDYEITAEMCKAAGFDTSEAGEHSVTFTLDMFDKTYSATFEYTVA